MIRITSIFNVLAAVVIAAGLSSCAEYVLVKPDKKVSINGSLTIDPQIDWNRRSLGKTEIWTVDGPNLQILSFFVGLKDGDIMFPSSGPGADSDKDKKKPKFSAKMSPIEIAELYDASYAQNGVVNFKTSNLRPETLAGQAGFRFDYTFTTEKGLDHAGFAVGFVKDEKLYMIAYSGAALYYFPKNLPDVKHLIESACLGAKSEGQPAGGACA